MITTILREYGESEDGKCGYIPEYRALSTDKKPTGVMNGAVWEEMDKNMRIYMYDAENEEWKAQFTEE